jgi:hypothetical protein
MSYTSHKSYNYDTLTKLQKQIGELAFQCEEDPDALKVLGDLILETNWHDLELTCILTRHRIPSPELIERDGFLKTVAHAEVPTKEWARCVAGLFFFSGWPFALSGWPVAQRCRYRTRRTENVVSFPRVDVPPGTVVITGIRTAVNARFYRIIASTLSEQLTVISFNARLNPLEALDRNVTVHPLIMRGPTYPMDQVMGMRWDLPLLAESELVLEVANTSKASIVLEAVAIVELEEPSEV